MSHKTLRADKVAICLYSSTLKVSLRELAEKVILFTAQFPLLSEFTIEVGYRHAFPRLRVTLPHGIDPQHRSGTTSVSEICELVKSFPHLSRWQLEEVHVHFNAFVHCLVVILFDCHLAYRFEVKSLLVEKVLCRSTVQDVRWRWKHSNLIPKSYTFFSLQLLADADETLPVINARIDRTTISDVDSMLTHQSFESHWHWVVSYENTFFLIIRREFKVAKSW